ncbi:MAG: S1 RNA-binding domain-containing protein [Sumerlaeia bacterium]
MADDLRNAPDYIDDPKEKAMTAKARPGAAPADDDDEDFEALLNAHLPSGGGKQSSGELFDAVVVGLLDDAVLVDFGGKAESTLSMNEFAGPKGVPTVKAGDQVRVMLLGYDDEGNAILSHRKARIEEAKGALSEAAERRLPVRGRITRVVKGGVIVDCGMDCFMPASQVDTMRVENLDSLVGQEIEAYVLEYDESRGRALVSRRQLLQERRESQRAGFLTELKPGQKVKGTVRDVLDFGVFVNIGPVEALLPRSEWSYERGVSPADQIQPGQEIEAKILDVNADTGKVTLSRKRLNVDPWLHVEENYPVGANVSGTVARVEDYGAFVNLEEGLTGLLHARDFSWETEQVSTKEKFREGDQVTCQVLEIDQQNRRLSLSLKHLSRDPWTDVEARYPAGSRQKGIVSRITDFGAFVKFDGYTEGLLHIGDLAWGKRPNHPSEYLDEGQEIEVRVLELDRDRRRISLGLKQLQQSPLDAFMEAHPVGSVFTAKVTRLAPFGAFVQVAENLDGLVHVSELDEERVDSPERVVRVDDEIPVKVLSVDADRGRISLSRRQAIRQMEQENIKAYMKQAEQESAAAGGAFGDLLKQAMDKKKKKK